LSNAKRWTRPNGSLQYNCSNSPPCISHGKYLQMTRLDLIPDRSTSLRMSMIGHTRAADPSVRHMSPRYAEEEEQEKKRKFYFFFL
jgi:hypothetical protein